MVDINLFYKSVVHDEISGKNGFEQKLVILQSRLFSGFL